MMPSIVRVVGAADGKTKTPHDGRYVVAWNPHVRAGTLAIESTDDRSKAHRFENGAEFDDWRTVSDIEPKRPWDGRPNRPLTAVHVEIITVPS